MREGNGQAGPAPAHADQNQPACHVRDRHSEVKALQRHNELEGERLDNQHIQASLPDISGDGIEAGDKEHIQSGHQNIASDKNYNLIGRHAADGNSCAVDYGNIGQLDEQIADLYQKAGYKVQPVFHLRHKRKPDE